MLRARTGIALISTLLMCTVFLMMLAVLLAAAHRGSFSSELFRKREANRFIAEEAAAVMLVRLQEQPDWETDIVAESTVFGGGTYTVLFSESESVNNLQGTDTKPGPYGNVAAGTAMLRIHAETQGYQRTFDVVVGASQRGPTTADAIVATGRVQLRGNVLITGTSAYNEDASVEANLVSNSVEDTNDLILWEQTQVSDELLVEGAVELPGTNTGAVDVGGATVDINRLSGPKPLEKFDIPGEIAKAKDRGLGSPPTIVSGSPVPAGEYYVNGDIELPGDLVLDGVKLYISGKLRVQGSIRGKGALFVGGSTTFKGAAELTPSAEHSVALMSHGSVELTGFNGSSYMETITANAGPDLQEVWQNTRQDMTKILEEVEQVGYAFDEESDADYRMRSLAHDYGLNAHPDNNPGPNQDDKIRQLTQLLEAQPASETRDFMLAKLKFLRNYDHPNSQHAGGIFGFARKDYHTGDWPSVLRQALGELQRGETHDGLFDVVNDILALDPPQDLSEFGGEEAVRALLVSGLRAYNMDNPGSAYFQGIVATNGWFYAGHEVSVVGSISVIGDPSVSEKPSWRDSPESASELTLQPGDLQLDGGTKVTYMNDVTDLAGTTQGTLGILYWLGH